MTHLMPRQTIEQIVTERDAIIEQALDAARACHEVQQRLGRVGCGSINDRIISNLNMSADYGIDAARRRITHDVDRAMWHHVLQASGIRERLSAKRLAEFERAIDHEPPAITVELLAGTLLSLAADTGAMLAESVSDLWRALSSEFKAHSKAPFPDKWIVDVETGYAGAISRVHRRLHDIDRILAQLDGAPVPLEYQQGLSGLVYGNWSRKVWEAETEYWTVKKYKNGRAHLRTKRPDLIAKLNQILIERGTYLTGA